ncbi:MAG: M23 family metallopeptidase [Ruminococcaceae bacterium]|nr:M23 family metallopeptidase [Oscillospiraceae bacterium]
MSEIQKKTSVKGKKTKKRKNKYNNNLYLYVQILVTAIFVVASVMLKVKDGEAFYSVKEDYSQFFTTEITEYSNFSYKKYIEKITADIAEKYDIMMQTAAYIYGKGTNDTYPANISLQKYVPEEKGIMPLKGIITSEFGVRKNPFNKKQKDFHTGIDIAAEKGVFIKAAFDGKVIETGYTDVAGNYIKIKTDDEMQTFYGHTQFVLVQENENIIKGQIIATVGDTGMVTGPHLHFEVLYNDNRVNPKYTVE